MSWYSALLERTVLPLVLHRDGRHSALKHRAFFEQSQHWSHQQLQDYQWEKLKQLLAHAYESCPYYTRVFDERGLTPDSFKSVDDLTLLPVLTKDLVFEHTEDILSTRFNRADLMKFTSGGTTGQQTTMYLNSESYNIKMASAWRFQSWIGMQPCDKLAVFWPVSMDIEEQPSFRTRIKEEYILRNLDLLVGSTTEEKMHYFYRELARFKPQFLKVFPVPLSQFAAWAEERSLPLQPVDAIITTGEPLYPDLRATIERKFGCPVFDMYGSREVGHTSAQCEENGGLHIAMETSVVEFLDNNQPVQPGSKGELFITDLTNYGFPLLRYQISDFGRRVLEQCRCGRHLDLMSAGVGRVMDDFIGTDGRRHSAHVMAVHITADVDQRIGQVQVIQRALTDFLIRITNNPEPTAEIFQFVEKRMKSIIGDEVEIEFEVVDRIPREKSGKTRFFICQIERTND